MTTVETIAAIATPPGIGGVGIIRVSGPLAKIVAKKMLGFLPSPRKATFCQFKPNHEVLDEGLALYFPAPHSFTGEDVLELQGHGGPVVLDLLLKSVLTKQVRLAKPGEFSERAFLNGKIDLTQAEAIADLINANSEQAAKSALLSLQGEFSKKINHLSEQLIQLRKMVEAAIDFPEEEIDFLSNSTVKNDLEAIIQELTKTLETAKQGALLKEGMTVVIAGRPNAGKSSLLNCLSGKDSAIVTEIAGTTRDVLREHIHLDGMPLHIVDTAGLRQTEDIVEQEGVKRALLAIKQADLILLVIDGSQHQEINKEIQQVREELGDSQAPVVVVENKIDLTKKTPEKLMVENIPLLRISAKKQEGLDLLRNFLKDTMGYKHNQEGVFIARRRHLEALSRALALLQQGLVQLQHHQAGELLAEDLRLSHKVLGEIVGEFDADALLGEIFSSFCIGK